MNISFKIPVRWEKVITAILISFTVVFGFQALLYIQNLNQTAIFMKLALWFWVYLIVLITLLYDLHFKNINALKRRGQAESVSHWLHKDLRMIGRAFFDRFEHLCRWEFMRHWVNYLLLPSLLFWSTAILFYLNFGSLKLQQIFFLLSSMAMILTYWYLKETFHRKTERVEADIFVALSLVKIYTAAISFAAALGIMRSYCLQPRYFVVIVFALTFLLIYQALFQHNLTNIKNLLSTLGISLLMSVVAYFLYLYWGYNYYTGAIFLTAFYNLFWGMFHYHLDHSLTKKTFMEILLISLLIASMVLSVTNFREKLLDGCYNQTTNGFTF